MNVILQKDVKNLGKVGDVVRVADGFARNYLIPRKLALEATDKKVDEMAHLQKVADAKRKKAVGERKTLIEKMSGLTFGFKVQAGEGDKLYGSITPHDISLRLEKDGYLIDKKDIHLEESIKVLGQHKAIIKLGDNIETTITLSVERT